MTESRSIGDPAGLVADDCCAETCHGDPVAHDTSWQHGAQWAWRLASSGISSESDVRSLRNRGVPATPAGGAQAGGKGRFMVQTMLHSK